MAHKGIRSPRLLVPMLAAKTPQHLAYSQDALNAGLLGLTALDIAWLRHYPNTPKLYDSGVFYKPEFSAEDWKTIPYLIKDGFGDCEDLASWRAAELQISGVHAVAFAKIRQLPSGSFRAHAVVRLPDGTIEDPSAKLGMYLYKY